MVVVTGLCWLGFLLCALRDPRRLRAGVWLLAALSLTGLQAAAGALRALAEFSSQAPAYLLLGVAGLLVLGTIVLAVALIGNGVTMLRREGHRLANALSGLLGVALLGYLALYAFVPVTQSQRLFGWLFTTVLPVGYLGFGFLAYIIYAACYGLATRLFARAHGVVVVLGAGLSAGRVTPLLASRLDSGQAAYERARAAGRHPVIVVSGGRGTDEPRSEAAAMAEYLAAKGVPADDIWCEDRSRTTEQNLFFTKQLLEQGRPGAPAAIGPAVGDAPASGAGVPDPTGAGVPDPTGAGVPDPSGLPSAPPVDDRLARPLLVVTSNFHAFRAATLMRKAGLRGQAIGAPTAAYYWPSATIREYAALLRDHKVFTIACLGAACLPLAGWTVGLLAGWIG